MTLTKNLRNVQKYNTLFRSNELFPHPNASEEKKEKKQNHLEAADVVLPSGSQQEL